MAGEISAQIQNENVYPISDSDLEEQLREAVEASSDDFALRAQLEEILRFSDYTFAFELQFAEYIDSESFIPLPTFDPSASSSASSFSFTFKEGNDYFKVDSDVVGRRGKEVDSGLETLIKCISYRNPESVPVELCGICFEESSEEMFEGLNCLHRFCHPCMTSYIRSRVEQKRHRIICPHDSCSEALTLQECRYFLEEEMLDAWSAAIVEAEISESEKVYCPFPDCSVLLVKEDMENMAVENLTNAECPFCYRMFCAECMVPWHADLECSEFQNLPPAERSQADLQLLKLAQDHKWQRCEKCKGMVELIYGCNHITCRCGCEFCYVCGKAWANGCLNCNCPRITETYILR